MTNKNCKLNGKHCPNCGKIHEDKTGNNNPFYGKKHTEETKKKMRENAKTNPNFGNKGKKLSEEHKIKIGLGNKGKIRSEETRRKLSKSHKGKTWEILHGRRKANKMKKKVSETRSGENHLMWGKHHTPETKNKIREANSGKNSILYGKPRSEETKRKISDKNGERLREMNIQRTGKTFEELYGTEKAKIINLKKHIAQKGEKGSNWQGGKSFEPYTPDFNKAFREKIRERDSYSCGLCGLFEQDAKKLYSMVLVIHHIDYNKLNTFPQNCISLCHKCHNLTIQRKDRELWTKHFQGLLKKLYGYKYSSDQKIILDFTGGKN